MNLKRALIILALLLSFFLCACSRAETAKIYEIEKNGKIYTIDTENKTIYDGANKYRYSVNFESDSSSVKIYYPDGSSYWWNERKTDYGSSGTGGWSDDYEPSKYVSGDILWDILQERAPRVAGSSTKNVLLIIIFLAIGILNIVYPEVGWYLEYGWRFKDAKPSEIALIFNRAGGVIVVIVAFFLVFM